MRVGWVCAAFSLTACIAGPFAIAGAAHADGAFGPWTGLYAGVHGGYGSVTSAPEPFDVDGFVGGFQLGYLHQFDQLVAGVEVDYSPTELSDTESQDAGLLGPVSAKLSGDDLVSVRARLGTTWQGALIYATAGYAWADASVKVSLPAFGISETRTEGVDGFVAGGGFEMMIMPNVSARLEGLRYWLDSSEIDGDFDVSVVRAALNYRFDLN